RGNVSKDPTAGPRGTAPRVRTPRSGAAAATRCRIPIQPGRCGSREALNQDGASGKGNAAMTIDWRSQRRSGRGRRQIAAALTAAVAALLAPGCVAGQASDDHDDGSLPTSTQTLPLLSKGNAALPPVANRGASFPPLAKGRLGAIPLNQ